MTQAHGPFVLLAESFSKRLLESDLLPDGVDFTDAASWVVAMFAAPAAMVTLWLFPKYALVADVAPEQFEAASRGDKLFFIGYSMTAVGLVTAIAWDALFPDRRDGMALGVLPVRGLTIVIARLTSLLVLIVGFALAINVLASVGFALAAAGASTTAAALRHLAAHLAATVTASLFVFLSLAALQSLLLVAVPHRARHTVSVLTQLLFIVILLEWFFFAPGLLARLTGDEPHLLGLGASAWLPPLWFLGLYEAILGTANSALRTMGTTAIVATATALGIFVVAYGASYRRLSRQAIEVVPTRATGPGRVVVGVRRLTFFTWVRHPVERAIFVFVAQSLARSRRHRLVLALYVGVGIALVIAGFVEPALRSASLAGSEPTTRLLSLPLVLSFFTLVALRVLFTIPTELEASWVFRMTESSDKRRYLAGVRKAMLLLGLAPVIAATFPLLYGLLGSKAAVQHAVFCLCLAALLTELLLTSFRSVPFTKPYLPGRSNTKLLWPLYLFAMTTYAYSGARLASWLLEDPVYWVSGCGVLATVAALLASWRRRALSDAGAFAFDESTEPTVQVLGLRA